MSDETNNVSPRESIFWFSLHKLSQCFGVSRETAAKFVSTVQPVGKKNGHDVYHLKDVCKFIDTRKPENYAIADPESLPPKDRKDWYEGERQRIQLLELKRQLIPADEFRDELSATIKQLIQFIDVMPDVLDQSLNLDPQVIEKFQELCDLQRESLYQSLFDTTDDQPS